MQVENYHLIATTTDSDLNHEVLKHIRDGWQPWGSAAIAHSGTQRYFTQAVVMYKKEKKQAFQA